MNEATSAASAARVLAIGLDSADRRLVREMVSEGELPHLGGLIDRGRSGVVRSPPGLGDDAAWASFSSCRSPGDHDRYFWRRLESGRYETAPWGDAGDAMRPFWGVLAERGRRVAVLDVPKSPLCDVPGGIQLADWLVHGRDGATRSHPPELAREILERFGDDRIDRPGTPDFLCRETALPADRHEEFLDRLRAGLAAKRRAASELLGRGGWDLFLVVFKESHCVGHEFWDSRGGATDPVRDVYQRLDAAVGELLAQVDADTHVLLFSGLGMEENHTAEHLLDQALLRLEPRLPRVVGDRYRRLEAVEDRLRRRLAPNSSASWLRGMRHWYQVPHNELSGAIRLNVRGREPSGRVEPGEDYERWCAFLRSEVERWVDPDSGRPVVERVVRSDEAFSGASREGLPDLFVVWKRDGPITGLSSPAIGVVRADDPGYRSGNHVADGFYVLAGPSVATAGPGDPVEIVGLGPLLADFLGVSLPGAERGTVR
jgi:predicted AlkP superfamily phosphohydrolase/phosphomutase